MHKNINEVELVIFDTETTGLEPQSGDRIVEIAALKVRAGKKLGTFQSLINPERKISEAAFAVNKISQDMLSDAPQMKQIMPQFLDFIKGSCVLSYNATFDLEFLNNELKLMNQPELTNIAVVDILKMAKRLLPGLQRYALWFVAQNMGIKQAQEHRAFSDVEITLEVFNKLKAILESKNITGFNNFVELFSVDKNFLHNVFNQRIAQIQEAINLRVGLQIKYLSTSNAEVTERLVVPKEIRQEKYNSYLVGYCCLKKEERTFRVDNILHLEIVKDEDSASG